MSTAPPIVPAVVSDTETDGSLDLSTLTSITASDDRARRVAETFVGAEGVWLPGGEVRLIDSRVDGGVHFDLRAAEGSRPALAPNSPESLGAHEIRIDRAGIVVSAASEEGLARGAATIVQLLADRAGVVSSRVIRDEAAWGWRSLSLDVVRYFSDTDQVLRVIDLLALYKFNVLHLHLSDNEGWRLEIPGWPQLTPTDADFFSLAEYRRIVDYATERFITVVPEIDLPGHAAAALRAYPELNPEDAARPAGPFPIANLSTDSPAAWRLVDDVVTTLAENTPGPFIHVGGDEAFGMEAAAHEAFVEHAIAAVRAAGKKSVGWQETSRANVDAEHTVQFWVDFDIDAPRPEQESGSTATEQIPDDSMAAMIAHFGEAMRDRQRILDKGLHLVISPISHSYLDRPHAESSIHGEQEQERSRIGLAYYPGTPVRDYLEWDPASVLARVDVSRIRGVEAALWCESIREASDIDALLLPRLPAVAEVAWSGSRRSDWDGFRDRIAHHAPLWDAAGWCWFAVDSVPWRR
ncbi:family 20 glycosylhydrolase [Microbacterium sp. NPDC089318]